MLVVTTFGIFIPSLRTDSPAKGEPELQIRSRRKSDLDQLRKRYMGKALGRTIYGRGQTDYQYRAYCTRLAWAEALAGIALDIDYLSAKHAVEGDKDLEKANVRIWSVLLDLFPTGSRYDRRNRQQRTRQQPARHAREPWDSATSAQAQGYPWERRTGDQPPPALFSDEEWDAALAMDSRDRRFPY